MEFDDEQLADENSVANMQLNFAGITKNLSKDFETDSENTIFLEISKLFRRADKFFEFEKQKHFGEIVDFFEEMKKVNNLELESLKQIYSQFKDAEMLSPEFIKNPSCLEELNRKLAQNELNVIQKLLVICFNEKNEENKKFLEKLIFRRLESLISMFFSKEN